MKKIKIVMVLIIVFMLNVLTGCSTDEKIHFFSDKVYYNHEGSEDKITFFVNYAYSDDSPEIELVELQGEGLENTSYVLGDISEETFAANSYNGYHLGSFYIDVDVSKLQDNETLSVSSIAIKCNGENKEINLKEELVFIKNDFGEECYRVPIQLRKVANSMPTSDIQYPIDYAFEINEEFTLTGFETSGLLDIKNISIFVNEAEVGNANEVLPLSLSKNDILKLEVTFSIDEAKENANIYTDVIISGLNAEEQLTKRHFALFLTGLFDEKDANKLTSIIGD